MCWLDLDIAGVDKDRFVECGVRHGLKLMKGRLVVHYQIGDEAVKRLGKVMDEVLGNGKSETSGKKTGSGGKEDGEEVEVEEGIRKEAKKVTEPEME